MADEVDGVRVETTGVDDMLQELLGSIAQRAGRLRVALAQLGIDPAIGEKRSERVANPMEVADVPQRLEPEEPRDEVDVAATHEPRLVQPVGGRKETALGDAARRPAGDEHGHVMHIDGSAAIRLERGNEDAPQDEVDGAKTSPCPGRRGPHVSP
jgi:hypothetical protein